MNDINKITLKSKLLISLMIYTWYIWYTKIHCLSNEDELYKRCKQRLPECHKANR